MQKGQRFKASPAFLATMQGNADVEATRILDTIRATRGNVSAAAPLLGYAYRSLRRWITDMELQPKIDEIRDAERRERGIRRSLGTD